MESKEEIIQIYDTDSNESCAKESKKNSEIYKIDSTDEDSSGSEIQWVEEESDTEPEIECDLWDNDCKILSYASRNDLWGYHAISVMVPNSVEPLEKKAKPSLEINNHLTSEEFIKEFKEAWQSDKIMDTQDFQLLTEPFKICIMQNYLENKLFLNNIRLQFNEIDWNKRNLDLYEFFQSVSLKSITEEYLTTIFDFLKNDVREWVSKLTGVTLTKTSATCSFYAHTDFLLVHDDLQEDRMFAFVLYLTGPETWISDWGGSLQLLSTDEEGHPNKVVKSIYPANNQLVLFPVTNKSFHQVEEVLTKNYGRLSINGWFHTDDLPKFEMPKYTAPNFGLYCENTIKALDIDIEFDAWIKQHYLQNLVMNPIQKHIEEYSEISLEEFFLENKLQEVLKNLQNPDVKWKEFGPPNRRNYSVLLEEDLPEVLKEFINLFKSSQMFSLLHGYTDLELTTEKAGMKYELQKWTVGSYSLLTDYNWNNKEELDVILYLGCQNNNIVGGKMLYVSLEEKIQDALITIEPVDGNLNLIYRDTARFTQYLSKQSTISEFYILICSYCEK